MNSPDPDPDELRWCSTIDAASRLGITARTLYRMIDEGTIPAYRFGRVFRFKADDIDAFLESSRVQPGSLGHLYPPPKVRGATKAARRN
jgi:excisionase family DNA binding protein